MNTKVPYKTPTHRNRYGRYVSRTFIKRHNNEIRVWATIVLVWFDALGWYYVLEIDAVDWRKTRHLERCFRKRMASKWGLWRTGKELELCAQAAEKAMRQLLKERKVTRARLKPYVLEAGG